MPRKFSWIAFFISEVLIGFFHTPRAFSSEPKSVNLIEEHYACRCTHSSDKLVSQGQKCNFPGFLLYLSGENALVSGYAKGMVSTEPKLKKDHLFYKGFESLDFHFKVSLDVGPKKNLKWRDVRLLADGERNFTEKLKCEQLPPKTESPK
jgi:hypothetical protein